MFKFLLTAMHVDKKVLQDTPHTTQNSHPISKVTHTYTHPRTRTHEPKHTLHKEDTHGQNIHKSRVKIGVPPWNGQWQTCRWGFKPV